MATLEAIVAIPILVIVTFTFVQFGIVMVVQSAVSHSANISAREAAKGADADELMAVANCILTVFNCAITPTSTDASLILEDPDVLVMPEQRGLLACSPPATPGVLSGNVRVTICVSLASPPMINAMSNLGIDLSDHRLEISAVARKET